MNSKLPDVLRTVRQLVADLQLNDREYSHDPSEWTETDAEALHLEWLASKAETGESFADFLKSKL